jgi:hypothetical protein
MDLCRYCRNISFKRSRASDWNALAVHQPSGEALQKSAHDGCPLCSKIWTALCRENKLAYDLHDSLHSQGQEIASDVCYDKRSPVILSGMRNNYDYIRIICGEIESCIMGNGRGLVPGGLALHLLTSHLLTFFRYFKRHFASPTRLSGGSGDARFGSFPKTFLKLDG